MGDTHQTLELEGHVLKKYEIERRIGRGAYGIVWKATDRKTKQVFALKKIFDAFQNVVDAQRTYREIMFLQALSTHPNIITLQAVHPANNKKDIYLVFDYMDADLHKVIRCKNVLKDIHKSFIMYQLLKATMYMHSGNVIHRDQKPSNILLDVHCNCKIADFGLARSVNVPPELDESSGDPPLTDYVATRWYRAPEILLGSTRYTKGVDMWSLGCILAEMLLERPLFPGTNSIKQLELICRALPVPSSEDFLHLARVYGGGSLISRQTHGTTHTLKQLLCDAPPDAVDLVEKLLVLNPDKRLTAAEALKHPYVAKHHSVTNKQELSLHADVKPPFSDNLKLSVEEYRSKLYELATEGCRGSMTPSTGLSNKQAPASTPSSSAAASVKRTPARRTNRTAYEEMNGAGRSKPVDSRERRSSLSKKSPQLHGDVHPVDKTPVHRAANHKESNILSKTKPCRFPPSRRQFHNKGNDDTWRLSTGFKECHIQDNAAIIDKVPMQRLLSHLGC